MATASVQLSAKGQSSSSPTIQEENQNQIGRQFSDGRYAERQENAQSQIGRVAGVSVVNDGH